MNPDLPDPASLEGLKADFGPRKVASTVATGLVLGLINALLTVALISLIFRGELRDALAIGIGFGLISSAVVGLIVALGSSFPGVYAGSQDASAAILGLSAASIAGVLAGTQLVDTVLAMVAMTSLATGLVFLAMGHFGLGDVARFVPFPVIGGLLAGTGYLIIAGSLDIVGLDSLSALGSSEAMGLAWPALAMAILLFISARRGWGSRAYLIVVVVGLAGFHVARFLIGVTESEAFDRGWLLGPFPEGSLWPGTIIGPLGSADWSLIAGEALSLIAILVIAPITLLLYISSLEIETRADLNMNRELRATGWANLAAGSVGGVPGYMYLADTVITERVAGRRRGPAVVAPVLMLAVVAIGAGVIELIPQFLVGGLLLFVGLEFVYEWLWVSRRRMTVPDYVLMWVIVAVIATIGFLPGVGVGLVAATALFVFRYSRIDVVKHQLTGAEHQSNMERSAAATEYLNDAGAAILILELQGFVFFGTASRVVARVREAVDTTPPPRQLVIDFRRVTGVDSSAVTVFERVAMLARERNFVVVLTTLANAQSAQFEDLVAEYRDVITVQPDLDHGLAWCEDRLLAEGDVVDGDGSAIGDFPSDLTPYLVEVSFAPGDVFMRQGDPPPGIFLLRSGQATVYLELPGGEQVRLRTHLGGTVLGEISLYRNEPCTATVVADTECSVLHLTTERFNDLCGSDPYAAADLHAYVARVLAGRVSHANRAIRALHD